MSERIKHRVARVEIGKWGDAVLILDDGSEVIGLTALSSNCDGPDQLPKWQASGYIGPMEVGGKP